MRIAHGGSWVQNLLAVSQTSPTGDASEVSPLHERRRRYVRACWAFLAYTVGVILWGAVVRATLSGDGCGDHWPMCNGEVVPPAPSVKTIIEFTHRLTSGLAWIGAAVFVFWARKVFPVGHKARRGANLGMLLMTTESLVGAALVVLKLVADNPDLARGWWAGAHLLNTFLLVAAQALHAWWAAELPTPKATRTQKLLFGLGIAGVLVLGMTGAIAALGDTLFRVDSLAEGIAQDFDPDSHLFVRLRTLHPVLALATGALLMAVSGSALSQRKEPLVRKAAGATLVFVSLQIALGFLNLMLLAPVWLQIVHLLVADVLWISLVLFAVCAGNEGAVD